MVLSYTYTSSCNVSFGTGETCRWQESEGSAPSRDQNIFFGHESDHNKEQGSTRTTNTTTLNRRIKRPRGYLRNGKRAQTTIINSYCYNSPIMISKHRSALAIFLCLFNVFPRGTASELNVTKLDCGMRYLALEHAKKITKNQLILGQISDALRLQDLCGYSHETIKSLTKIQRRLGIKDLKGKHCVGSCVYVTTNGNVAGTPDGSIDRPYASIHDAIARARSSEKASSTIVLREGVHSLQAKTLQLTSDDRGLSIIGFPGESVWISGGLNVDVDFETTDNGLFVANLTTLLANHDRIPSLVSLFTTSRRYTRARYPNSDPEVDQW
jgi:hypothetical protein